MGRTEKVCWRTMMKYAHEFYWPDTESHFIEYLDAVGHGEYQIVPKTVLDIVVTDWNCVIDIGAHVGTWSRWFAKRANHVHSFEPIKTNFACLIKNLEEYNHCKLYNNAVSDQSKHITIWKPADLSNTGTFSSIPLPNWEELEFQAIAIDELDLAPTVIKIDIQGGEYPALLGSKQTIAMHKPVICWENSTDNPSRQDIYKLLQDLSYVAVCQFKEDAVWVHNSYQVTQEQRDKLTALFKQYQKVLRPENLTN
jgi:FkbM family methyltransferase